MAWYGRSPSAPRIQQGHACTMPETRVTPWPARLPFFYGWIIVAVAFATVGLGVTARTAFSLMLPPIVAEFGWERGLASGAFSFGFLVSALVSPLVGGLLDRRGPRFVIEIGVLIAAGGLLGATLIAEPWHLYATLGLLVGGGVNCFTFTVHSQYLPNWFARRRALAIGIAFSGVGVGAITLLPWLQGIIQRDGWRASCWTLGLMLVAVLLPLNLLVWRRPQDLGLEPDGDRATGDTGAAAKRSNIVDPAWAAIEWTTARALRTGRFWLLAVGYFCATFVWYAVQVHQTKYLIEVGFAPMQAAWALGLVAMVGVPGQIALGALSDATGRELVWSIACAGFAICYGALLALEGNPSPVLLYLMVAAQGALGYSLTSILGPIVAEIFEGPHFGRIFGLLSVALIGGGAAGPLAAGLLYDLTGNYRAAFGLAIPLAVVSAAAIWLAGPRKVRLVPGRLR